MLSLGLESRAYYFEDPVEPGLTSLSLELLIRPAVSLGVVEGGAGADERRSDSGLSWVY